MEQLFSGVASMNEAHVLTNIEITGDLLMMNVDGIDYQFELSTISKKLMQSSDDVKNNFIVSPSGYGIHWPAIDEDLSIDALIGVRHHRVRSKVS